MARFTLLIAAAWLALATATLGAENKSDSDGDGILDRHEKTLGTDPAAPEVLKKIVDDGVESEARRKQEGYDARKDFTTVEFGHVGDDRYLWRATFADKPSPADTVFHLYVDADADSTTGRQGPEKSPSSGTEYMLTVSGDSARATHYRADGTLIPGPPVTFVVDGNTLLITADVDLGRDDQGVRSALYVLCHDRTEPDKGIRMSDSTGKNAVAGVPLSKRKKVMRLCDHAENFGISAAFGLDMLCGVIRDKDTLVVPHDKLTLDGFSVELFTSKRFPHLRPERTEAKAWTKAPKPGRYHVGFMMYDDSGSGRVGIFVDGKLRGVAVSNQNNNRTWLYWLTGPIEFKGGERVELRTTSAGRYPICNILFLPKPPPARKIEYRVENTTSATHVGRPGNVTISWTTTWPCPTRFEYGACEKYGTLVENELPCLVHRVVLEGLDPAAAFHGRAIGATRDGAAFHGKDFTFQAAAPVAPQTQAEVASVPLTVHNPYKFAIANWPVTTGVPFPQGKLGSADQARLVGPSGEVPAQVRLTARWLDGSVKWLLINFQASVPAEAQSLYRLEFGREVRRVKMDTRVSVAQDATGVVINAGALQFRIDAHGNLTDFRRGDKQVLSAGAACRSLATDAAGKHYTTAGGKAQFVLEETGPLRAVVKVTSRLADKDGATLVRIEKRVEAYRDTPLVRVHHTFVVDNERKFTDIDQLSYRIPLPGRKWQIALADGKTLTLDDATPGVRQRFDDELVTIRDGKETPAKQRLIGSAISGGDAPFAVAVRDFWQNYPKGFSLAADGLDIGLCPPFEAGLYDKFPFEKEGHHLYYYLLDGRYRVKRGVAKTHEMLLCFEPPEQADRLCSVFQRPLLATAPPEWYCGSKAFYDVAPRDTEQFKLYEEAIDRNIPAYMAQRERQHDFGMMNFGDWYGERRTNWGNIEYDTQHAFLLEYIRSGNPDAFYLGSDTELHNRDIDTVQWSSNPSEIGAVYVHQMCHVGEYYDKPVPDSLGFPRGGYTVSHAWTEGHFDHYFLTGDRRSDETGRAVADFFIRKQLGRPYDFSTCRVPGWHLIMLSATYAATGDPYYLNASKVIVERVLATQDKQPRLLPDYQQAGRKPYQVGGWSRMMVPGHCHCEPRHRGNAGFMVAVLLSGMKYYHDVTGDPRVKEAIIQGAHYLCEECYSDETHGFRYTSCPKTQYSSGASPLMVEGIARAYLWTKDDRFRRVLTDSLPRGARGQRYGKGFSMYYRMAPRLLWDLSAAGISLSEPAAKKP